VAVTIVFGACALVLALLGPIGLVLATRASASGSKRRRLHAVLEDASGRVRGNGRRVLRARGLATHARRRARASRDLGDPAALPAAVVAGGFAAIVALFALLVTETDEAFANAYSAAVSLQNAFPPCLRSS